MELPKNLIKLYKHWSYHTKQNEFVLVGGDIDQKVLKDIKKFAIKRQKIWEKKTKREQPPYIRDKILNKYKFCNIYRELDRQTIEIHSLLKPIENKFDLWLLNVLFNRFICKPETVKQIGNLSFDVSNNKSVYEKLVNLSKPKYGAAYIFPVSLIMQANYPTREEFFCFYLPKVAKKCAKLISTFHKLGVVDSLEQILPVFGFNMKFHWTEVFIDIAYQFPEYIDLYKKFPIGPGSIPTMKLLSSDLEPEEVCIELSRLPFKTFPHLTCMGKPVQLCVENWEGMGCEYRKYSNLTKGIGRKRFYG